MKKITRRAGLALPALFLPGLAQAQNFPTQNMRYIVPFAPAGLTDIMARLVAQRLSEGWARPVVVENRAGGNGMIGADTAAKAPPDGHTLLAITLTHAVNVALYPQAPYDLLRDFAVVSVLGGLPLVVTVHPAIPATTLPELLALARTRTLNVGSSGSGSPPHLGLELLRGLSGAGTNLTHVPYRGGAQAVTDLVAGNLDAMVSNLPECVGQIQAGRLRALAVTSAERHRMLPETPTVAEAGSPSLALQNWTALLAPAATPQPTLAEIERATLAAIRHPETRRRAEDTGFDVLGWDAARSRGFVTAEVARWAALVREVGIRGD